MHKFMHFKLPLRGAYFLVLISFLVALSMSFLAPIFPLYIKTLVSKEAYVGYVSAAIAIMLLASNFIASRFLDHHKKLRLLRLGLFGSAVTVALVSVINQLHYFLILEVFRTFFLVSVYITLALFLKDCTRSSDLGKLEGMNFTLSNVAWLIGPLFGALLAEKYSMQLMFILGSIFPIAALILVNLYPIKEEPIKKITHNNTFENIKSYFKDKDLTILYLLSMGVLIWWTIIYTFTPLFIKQNNLGTSFIGYLMFAVTIPLILLEIPIGKLADKHGCRKYFFIGFLIIAITAASTYFFNIFGVLILIVLASIGAAFLEPLREAYLFKKLNRTELIRKYPVFRTSTDLGQFVGPIIFSTILLYSNFKVLYVVAGLIMFIMALIALKIKDIK